eukprot:8129133-Lingulodinium_polyedra.AAC.1
MHYRVFYSIVRSSKHRNAIADHSQRIAPKQHLSSTQSAPKHHPGSSQGAPQQHPASSTQA